MNEYNITVKKRNHTEFNELIWVRVIDEDQEYVVFLATLGSNKRFRQLINDTHFKNYLYDDDKFEELINAVCFLDGGK